MPGDRFRPFPFVISLTEINPCTRIFKHCTPPPSARSHPSTFETLSSADQEPNNASLRPSPRSPNLLHQRDTRSSRYSRPEWHLRLPRLCMHDYHRMGLRPWLLYSYLRTYWRYARAVSYGWPVRGELELSRERACPRGDVQKAELDEAYLAGE